VEKKRAFVVDLTRNSCAIPDRQEAGYGPLDSLGGTPPADYLYSLYDALVSINVPSDKARAVVDAMERDMGTTLATKQDLLLIRQEIENRYTLLSREIDSLRGEVGKDLEALRLSMTLRLGSTLVVGFGVLLAALRLWL